MLVNSVFPILKCFSGPQLEIDSLSPVMDLQLVVNQNAYCRRGKATVAKINQSHFKVICEMTARWCKGILCKTAAIAAFFSIAVSGVNVN